MQTVASTFKEFWITGDPKRRGRWLAFTTFLMAGYGLVVNILGGQARDNTAHQALVVGALIMALCPFVGKRKQSPPKPDLRPKKDVIVILSSVAGILLIGQTSLLLQDRVATQSLKGISEGKVSESELSKTERALQVAGNSGVVIPQSVMDAAYHRLAGTSERPAEPRTWEAGLGLLSYRSSLNVSEMPPGNATPEPDEGAQTKCYMISPTGKHLPTFSVVGRAEIEKAARLELIASPIVQPQGIGNQFLIATGGAMSLDGERLTHVALVNVEVHYHGGPLVLEDVRFINCRFVFENTNNSRTLSARIFTTPRVDMMLQG
jgi:hypothetical protein